MNKFLTGFFQSLQWKSPVSKTEEDVSGQEHNQNYNQHFHQC